MELKPLKLEGAFEIILAPRVDERGYFMRTYDAAIFRKHGLSNDWVQENQSYSRLRGIVRGLHFQRPPHTETKLVRVSSGAVLDVLVDLRTASPTYGQWDTVELSVERQNMAYVPKGFAHGFCTLTSDVLVHYKVDAYYAPDHEGGLRWNDATLAIPWPDFATLVSEKDSHQPLFQDFVSPF